MTASSQNTPGAQPPESPYAMAAAVAQAGPVALSPVRVASGVIRAAMANGSATAEDIAQAEADAGVIFDPQRAQDIWNAAYEQARAEGAAELAGLHQQLAAVAGSRRQVDAVMRLCEGRAGDDLLLVSAVAVAAESGSTALDSVPMVVRWTGEVSFPISGRSIVRCVSSYGQRADLVVEGADRVKLSSLVDAEIRDPHEPCPTDGCGTVDDYDASAPALFGWSRLEVAALGDSPRWYCSDRCVFDALARARHDLTEADRQAEADPDEQVPYLVAEDGAL
ncbi:MAG: hypothetical protein HOZ81_27955 [Streptomyces sp.]|nr:hypothetical protein [Streptomyces sp.]